VTGEFEYLQSKKTPGCTSATAQGFYDAGYYGVQFCACGGNPSEGASCGDGPIVIKKPPNAI
jgi:hypothetical protein